MYLYCFQDRLPLAQHGFRMRTKILNQIEENTTKKYWKNRCSGITQDVAVCQCHKCSTSSKYSVLEYWSKKKGLQKMKVQHVMDCTSNAPNMWDFINSNITMIFKQLLLKEFKEIIKKRDSRMCFSDGRYVGTLHFESIKLELELAVGQNLDYFEKYINEIFAEC